LTCWHRHDNAGSDNLGKQPYSTVAGVVFRIRWLPPSF
jgi:hypothetical protein